MNAAISKIITWLPSDEAASAWVNTPARGNSANGISEVAGMGSASVTHNIATNKVMPAVSAISALRSEKYIPEPSASEVRRATRIINELLSNGLLALTAHPFYTLLHVLLHVLLYRVFAP